MDTEAVLKLVIGMGQRIDRLERTKIVEDDKHVMTLAATLLSGFIAASSGVIPTQGQENLIALSVKLARGVRTAVMKARVEGELK